MSKRAFTLASISLMAGVCFAAEGAGSGSGGYLDAEQERVAKIRFAIEKLNPTEDTHWTEGGLPAMDHMKASTGLDDLKRDEVSAVAPGLHRANVGAAPSDLGNVGGGGDAGPTEEQEERRGPELWTEGHMPHDLAAMVKDPIFLIEAAMAAMNADVRYSKNSELQSFMRHYLIAQPNIKAHQLRLDKRYADVKAAG